MANKIQLLRNATISADKSTAKTNLGNKLANLNDGEIAINRYQDGEQVKVLLGFNNKVGTGTKTFILDPDAIPAEVQTALDEITGGGSGSGGGAIDKAKEEVIGKDTDTKDSDTVKGAKKYADNAVSVAIADLDVADSVTTGSFVASVSETDGKIAVTKGAITGETITVTGNADGSMTLEANIDGTTIVKDGTTKKLSVASSALTQYVGSNAVSVGAVSSDNKKTISLGINANDKVLSQSASGLLATLTIGYDSTNKKIQLKGNNSTVVSEFDASAFVKDGMLADAQVFTATAKTQTVTFDDKTTHEYTGLTVGHHYVAFEFNTTTSGTVTEYKYDILDATDIVDVYGAGNGLDLSGHTFSVKLDSSSDSYLTVGTSGIKLSGVTSAISNEVTRAKAAEETNATNISNEVARAKAAEETNATNISAEVTRAKGVENTVIGGVGLNSDGSHKTTTGNYTSKATTIAGEISALDGQVKTNADAISAEVTARATAITNAINALDVTAVGGTGKVITTVSETDGKISATAIDLNAGNVAATATTATDTAVAVTGTTVKEQIASLAASIAIIDCGTY